MISCTFFQLIYCYFMIDLKASLHFFFRQVSSETQKLPWSLKQPLDLKKTLNYYFSSYWMSVDLLKFLAPFPVRIKRRLKLLLLAHTCTHICKGVEIDAQLIMLKEKKCYFFLWINFQSRKIRPTGRKKWGNVPKSFEIYSSKIFS